MNTEKVMEVLRRLEWAGWDYCWDEALCYYCKGRKDRGHRDDCKLAALLGEGEKEKAEVEGGRGQEQIDPWRLWHSR